MAGKILTRVWVSSFKEDARGNLIAKWITVLFLVTMSCLILTEFGIIR